MIKAAVPTHRVVLSMLTNSTRFERPPLRSCSQAATVAMAPIQISQVSSVCKVLHLARRLAEDIEQQGDWLRWAPDSGLERFEAACNAQSLDEAVAVHGGELMSGLDPAWPAETRDWLHAERQRLRARWHEAAHRRLTELLTRQAEPPSTWHRERRVPTRWTTFNSGWPPRRA